MLCTFLKVTVIAPLYYILNAVTISSPYQNATLLPRDSSFTAFCTASVATQERLFWAISVANSNIDAATFTNEETLLNNKGFFSAGQTALIPNSENTIQLNVTKTDLNNGSTVKCIRSGTSRDIIAATTFIVYGM